MLFHTWIFAAFLAVVLPIHLLVRRTRFGSCWLLIASYTFYAAWNPLFLILIVVSTAIDYAAVRFMERTERKRRWLVLSLCSNLGLLGFFKYAGFVTDNVNVLLQQTGYAIPAPDVLLPVGISFFTFQSMSYTIDAYRGQLKVERSFVRFAAFVSLFPQLVAGPIERAKSLLPQLATPAKVRSRDVADGVSLFFVGIFKKVALADWLALYVDKVYEAPEEFQGPALALATFAFGWQIYFDFSGYTDMARGVARVMGFRLMVNFNNPYVATDLGDFWNRWHISLSTWFRDYVYIPLGGNRRGAGAMYRNIFITMILSGLWHGAAWGFLIWGGLHAVGRLLMRPLERSAVYKDRVPKILKQLLVFTFVTFAWVFFRAQTWEASSLFVTRMFTSGWGDPEFPMLLLGMVLSVWGYQLLYSAGGSGKRFLDLAPVRIGLVLSMIAWLLLVAQPASRPFIYFQF